MDYSMPVQYVIIGFNALVLMPTALYLTGRAMKFTGRNFSFWNCVLAVIGGVIAGGFASVRLGILVFYIVFAVILGVLLMKFFRTNYHEMVVMVLITTLVGLGFSYLSRYILFALFLG